MTEGADSMDTWAREQIGKLWGDLREGLAEARGEIRREVELLRQALVGINGDNGIRGDLITLTERVAAGESARAELDSKLQHYLDVERRETCHGIEALEAHEAQEAAVALAEEEAAQAAAKEETEVKVENIRADATKGAANVQALASLAIQSLVLIGVVLTLILKK
jgi:hypothetical protein